jgi:hypothetical protein
MTHDRLDWQASAEYGPLLDSYRKKNIWPHIFDQVSFQFSQLLAIIFILLLTCRSKRPWNLSPTWIFYDLQSFHRVC